MPKRSRSTVLALPPRDASMSHYRWLSTALRTAILEGRIRPGTRLPSSRDLARQYDLARGTVISAFAELRAEGYVTGAIGSGTYVSKVLPDELLHVNQRAAARTTVHDKPIRFLSSFAKQARPFPAIDPRPVRAFRSNVIALDLFPTTLWAQVAARRLRRATVHLLCDGEPLGYRPLQEALADYLTTARGVRCKAQQIVIVAGVQEALSLAGRILLDPGDRVCVEEPGYIGATVAFAALGASRIPLVIDQEGAQLPNPRSRPRLAYVTPAHQLPLGVSMSLPRRLAWLDWARRSKALIFEDDYDSEFRFAGRPLPALQGLDRHDVVLFAGSFSKVLFPSLRLGYLVVPEDMIDVFATAKSVSNRHAPLPAQAVLCDFISEGHFGRHVRRMREVYAERRAVLLDAVRQHLAGRLEFSAIEAGLQTMAWMRGNSDAAEVAAAAAERGVEVIPITQSQAGKTRQGLKLGFAAVDNDEIRRGVRDLAAALDITGRTSGAKHSRRAQSTVA